jgi:hypothetical protein
MFRALQVANGARKGNAARPCFCNLVQPCEKRCQLVATRAAQEIVELIYQDRVQRAEQRSDQVCSADEASFQGFRRHEDDATLLLNEGVFARSRSFPMPFEHRHADTRSRG